MIYDDSTGWGIGVINAVRLRGWPTMNIIYTVSATWWNPKLPIQFTIKETLSDTDPFCFVLLADWAVHG